MRQPSRTTAKLFPPILKRRRPATLPPSPPWRALILSLAVTLPAPPLARAAPLRVRVSPRPLTGAQGAPYSGTEPCRPCHRAIYEHWRKTAHAGAWQTLKKNGEEQNPSCLRCHTTGFGEKGGFGDQGEDPRLRGVQCEACHGPGGEHLSAPEKPWKSAARNCSGCELRRVCMPCHTPAHSPRFNLNEYLDKTGHPR